MTMMQLVLIAVFAPLAGSALAGFFGKTIGRANSHRATILGVAISLAASVVVFMRVLEGERLVETLYTWAQVGSLKLSVGFMIDSLSAGMMVVVTSVSLMVHIYTIGYMEDDDGYQRFFSYISLFTFSMLMLVTADNFLQLFFGWEAVGLVSYLLIGFWFKKPSAVTANMKAFLVNRVGDFGFILGIGLVVAYTGSLAYVDAFTAAPTLVGSTLGGTLGGAEGASAGGLGSSWDLLTVMGICLFIGAMGKSAQFPLHVWLPDSMEGPTPISALIHAATMVTAGIFMVSRMSPVFELAPMALDFILVIGAITAFFMGLLGLVQHDIKRVVAYSTLSQLGYMTVALGASAYSMAVFHLVTHAFFKALLFLAAGSVIIGMHHEQDMRHMGGLWKKMPITWLVSLLGSLALIGTPLFSGFYSKDLIIEAVHAANRPAAEAVYYVLLAGVFITSLYSFRMFFMVFHGKPRWDAEHHEPHESPWVVTLPLVLLAVPSVALGFYAVETFLMSDFFAGVIFVADVHPAMATLQGHWDGALGLAQHAVVTPAFWLSMSGIVVAFVLTIALPAWQGRISSALAPITRVLENKYYMDDFNAAVFAGGARQLGTGLWRRADQGLIDGLAVNGSASLVGRVASLVRLGQTGYLYHYAIAMILGVALMLWWFAPLLYRSFSANLAS